MVLTGLAWLLTCGGRRGPAGWRRQHRIFLSSQKGVLPVAVVLAVGLRGQCRNRGSGQLRRAGEFGVGQYRLNRCSRFTVRVGKRLEKGGPMRTLAE